MLFARREKTVLLATAMVRAQNNLGQQIPLRAMIVFGSHGSVITLKRKVEYYILKKITDPLPKKNLKSIQLADPTFHKTGKTDLLLGADTAMELADAGLIRGQSGEPIALKTRLGWVVLGKIYQKVKQSPQMKCLTATIENRLGSREGN